MTALQSIINKSINECEVHSERIGVEIDATNLPVKKNRLREQLVSFSRTLKTLTEMNSFVNGKSKAVPEGISEALDYMLAKEVYVFDEIQKKYLNETDEDKKCLYNNEMSKQIVVLKQVKRAKVELDELISKNKPKI